MATNVDAIPFLGGAIAPTRQVGRVKEIPLAAAWSQPPDQPCAIADRCRAAMFGIYLWYKNIPEDTARHIFQKHEGGCAASWLRVDAHERRMSEAAPLVRAGIGDRCLAAMFGLYLRCKGITEDTAREIFKGHVGSRRPCVLAWFKVHGRSSIDDLASGRIAPALPNLAVEWAASSSPARDLAGLQPRLQQAAETSQHLHHASRMEDFAVHACADVLHKELVTQWRERFARACAGAAWDDSEVRALMSQQPDEEQLKLREEITALAQKAGQRAGAPLERDPEPLAVQIVAGEITIHRAWRTIPQNPDLAGEGNGSAGRSTHGSSSSALLDAPKRGLPPAGDIRARALPHIRR